MADDRSLQGEIDRYLAAHAKDPQGRSFAPLAEAYRKAGKIEEALRVVTEGLKIHPTLPGALATYGRCLLAKGDIAGAKVQLEKAVKLSPENLSALGALADVHEKAGDRDGAVKTLRTIILLNPNDPSAQTRLTALTAGGASSPAASEKGRAEGFQVKPAG